MRLLLYGSLNIFTHIQPVRKMHILYGRGLPSETHRQMINQMFRHGINQGDQGPFCQNRTTYLQQKDS
jgi:hypothetical protein